MTPSHTRKRGRLYRYYVSTDLLKREHSSCPVRRVPAAQIEGAVVNQIRIMVRSPEIVVATWRALKAKKITVPEREVRAQLHRFNDVWSELFPIEQTRLVRLLVDRVDVG